MFEPAGLLGQAPRQAQLEARAPRRVRKMHPIDPGVPPILPNLAEYPLKLEPRNVIRPESCLYLLLKNPNSSPGEYTRAGGRLAESAEPTALSISSTSWRHEGSSGSGSDKLRPRSRRLSRHPGDPPSFLHSLVLPVPLTSAAYISIVHLTPAAQVELGPLR